MRAQVSPDWWKTLFDEVYLVTDARSVCNEELTRREVDLVCRLLPIGADDKLLDLCGGHGRHSFELWARGFTRCTVVDYSLYLLQYARDRAAGCASSINFLRGDARATAFTAESFDHVLIMGNSLGYLPEATDDGRILAEAKRVLIPGGCILVDVADGEAVKRSLNPVAWHEAGEDIVVCRRRELRGDMVWARELVLGKREGLIRDCNYAIRLYEADMLRELLRETGFRDVKVYTDFSVQRPGEDYGFMNQRMIAVGRKTCRRGDF